MKNPPLPSYEQYKKDIIGNDIKWPLLTVKSCETGLLSLLPKTTKRGWPWSEEVLPSDYSSTIRWPKITVVSPSYNQGKYFEETIRSILLQNYPNLEYIIFDGGSNDETSEVINKYRNFVSFARSEKDRGQSHAINKGFSLASGEILCWLNSDDYFTEGALKKVAKTFMETGAQFIYGDSYNLKNEKLYPSISPIILDRYLSIPGLAQPSVFWSSSIHQPIWEELNCTMDFELWMRIAKGVKKKYIHEFLSIARVHDEAKTYSSDEKMKEKWKEDHERQWNVYGPIKNWDKLNRENKYLQRIFTVIPYLKSFF
ncbi:glycosyltransferase family 2 protein [Desertivirga arenae]|uniref:glycosyltransferase family 2 protein n=1 Tax=Desertivirga arenae TaxID=2810309 RepID=UPI001A957CD0|nr:glycosyltransferase family 2 protein [Pedobacter sp. SYSU D00823]